MCFDPRPGEPESGGGGSGGRRGSGSPGPSARESCIDVAGRKRSSREEERSRPRPQRGPGLSRSLEPGVPREEELMGNNEEAPLCSLLERGWEWEAQEGGDLPQDRTS